MLKSTVIIVKTFVLVYCTADIAIDVAKSIFIQMAERRHRKSWEHYLETQAHTTYEPVKPYVEL